MGVKVIYRSEKMEFLIKIGCRCGSLRNGRDIGGTWGMGLSMNSVRRSQNFQKLPERGQFYNRCERGLSVHLSEVRAACYNMD